MIDGHRVQVAQLPNGRFNLGIDGWLIGTADDVRSAVAEIRESLRMMNPFREAPNIQARFVARLSEMYPEATR